MPQALSMTAHRPAAALLALATITVPIAACGDDDDSASTAEDVPIDVGDASHYAPDVDPADFVEGIDNPYLPLAEGSRWTYESETEDGLERIEVEVTDEGRAVMGVDVTVVRDTVTLDGEVIEDTWDWYAQDTDGNVWYFGEDTKEYDDDGSVSTAGSWEAGVDGAQPGIVMYAEPQVGQAYRQEYSAGEAEDVAEVVRDADAVDVPAGSYDEVLVILEWNPFDPDVLEEKSYAGGIGVVQEQQVRGGDEVVELVEYTVAG